MFNCWVYICVFLCWSAGTDWSWSQGLFGYHQLNQNFTQRTCLHNFFLKGAFSYTATYRWDWCLPCIPPKKSLSPSVFTNGITLHPPDQARCLGFITDISSTSHTISIVLSHGFILFSAVKIQIFILICSAKGLPWWMTTVSGCDHGSPAVLDTISHSVLLGQ